jgi:hypothetical protein
MHHLTACPGMSVRVMMTPHTIAVFDNACERRAVCTTNSIESLNYQLWKVEDYARISAQGHELLHQRLTTANSEVAQIGRCVPATMATSSVRWPSDVGDNARGRRATGIQNANSRDGITPPTNSAHLDAFYRESEQARPCGLVGRNAERHAICPGYGEYLETPAQF